MVVNGITWAVPKSPITYYYGAVSRIDSPHNPHDHHMISPSIIFDDAKRSFVELTLSQTTNFRLFQTEMVCRRLFKFFCYKCQTVIQTGKNHCGKRRNCSLRAISHFPALFLKDLYCRQVKTRAFWEMVKTLLFTYTY